MTKTYEQLREQTEELYEVRMLRSGAAVFYATKVRQSGKQLEMKVRDATNDFSQAKSQDELPKKLDKMLDGLTALGEALVAHRQMVGNLTGVAVSAALLAERSDKQITTLIKGSKRR